MTMPISAALPRRTLRSRQRGMSFISVVLLGVIVVALFAIGSQSVPIFLESQAIHKAAAKAARESTVAEARAAFDRAAAIDSIESVKANDLQVTKANDRLVVSYSYSREIHLFGPAYLVYRFQNSTAP
jgi:Domain of unknown function (DUF4845)